MGVRDAQRDSDAGEVTPAQVQVLGEIREAIRDRTVGLPDPVFDFALNIVPMINVDVFVVDSSFRFLLAWREDEYAEGWHVPGGIIRWGETFAQRLERTALGELGATIAYESCPSAIAQLYGDRGHFISLLYRCTLRESPGFSSADEDKIGQAGEVAWFSTAPVRLYPSHLVYQDVLKTLARMDRASPPHMLSLTVSERFHATQRRT